MAWMHHLILQAFYRLQWISSGFTRSLKLLVSSLIGKIPPMRISPGDLKRPVVMFSNHGGFTLMPDPRITQSTMSVPSIAILLNDHQMIDKSFIFNVWYLTNESERVRLTSCNSSWNISVSVLTCRFSVWFSKPIVRRMVRWSPFATCTWIKTQPYPCEINFHVPAM